MKLDPDSIEGKFRDPKAAAREYEPRDEPIDLNVSSFTTPNRPPPEDRTPTLPETPTNHAHEDHAGCPPTSKAVLNPNLPGSRDSLSPAQDSMARNIAMYSDIMPDEWIRRSGPRCNATEFAELRVRPEFMNRVDFYRERAIDRIAARSAQLEMLWDVSYEAISDSLYGENTDKRIKNENAWKIMDRVQPPKAAPTEVNLNQRINPEQISVIAEAVDRANRVRTTPISEDIPDLLGKGES